VIGRVARAFAGVSKAVEDGLISILKVPLDDFIALELAFISQAA
jgi:hypothetical protein